MKRNKSKEVVAEVIPMVIPVSIAVAEQEARKFQEQLAEKKLHVSIEVAKDQVARETFGFKSWEHLLVVVTKKEERNDFHAKRKAAVEAENLRRERKAANAARRANVDATKKNEALTSTDKEISN